MAGISRGVMVTKTIEVNMLKIRIIVITVILITLQIQSAVLCEKMKCVNANNMRPPSNGYIGSKL